MGRPPSNGVPSFRFNSSEVSEMEAILQAHNTAMPTREILEALAEKFSASAERSGKFVVQMKQVWNWFQNRRYALRAKASKAPGKLNVIPIQRDDSAIVRNVAQAPQLIPAPQPIQAPQPISVTQLIPSPEPISAPLLVQARQALPAPQPIPSRQALPAPQSIPVKVRNVPQATQYLPATVQGAGRNGTDNGSMEFEAKSARDGAWYDVTTFLSHRNNEMGDPEVLVRFTGFGAEEDEWVNIRKLVRQRSLPCESSECVAVLPGDLILCFQEGKEQALYFDAHVLDAQRRRHDVRGCRCRFLVRYDHDQSEEIVPLRKVCRRPETDYRLQQLHALKDSASANQLKAGGDPHTATTLRVYPPAEATQKQHKADERADVPMVPAAYHTNLPSTVKAQQPKVVEIAEGTEIQHKAKEHANIVPATSHTNLLAEVQQPKVVEIAEGTENQLKVEEHANVVPSAAEIKVQQPKVVEIAGGTKDAHKAEELANVVPMVPAASHTILPEATEVKDAQPKVTEITEATSKQNKTEESDDVIPVMPAASHTNLPSIPESKSASTKSYGVCRSNTKSEHEEAEECADAVPMLHADSYTNLHVVTQEVEEPKVMEIDNANALENSNVAAVSEAGTNTIAAGGYPQDMPQGQ